MNDLIENEMTLQDYMEFMKRCRSVKSYFNYEEKVALEKELEKMGKYKRVFAEDYATAGAYLENMYKDLQNEGIYYVEIWDTDNGYLYSIVKYQYVGKTKEEEVIGDRKFLTRETNPDKMKAISDKVEKIGKFVGAVDSANDSWFSAWEIKDKNMLLIFKENEVVAYK